MQVYLVSQSRANLFISRSASLPGQNPLHIQVSGGCEGFLCKSLQCIDTAGSQMGERWEQHARQAGKRVYFMTKKLSQGQPQTGSISGRRTAAQHCQANQKQGSSPAGTDTLAGYINTFSCSVVSNWFLLELLWCVWRPPRNIKPVENGQLQAHQHCLSWTALTACKKELRSDKELFKLHLSSSRHCACS